MKAIIFNCHGKMKIAPSFKVIPADKNVIFLCKEGKTLIGIPKDLHDKIKHTGGAAILKNSK